jgi:hypothetical protein
MPLSKEQIQRLKINVPIWIDTLMNNDFDARELSFAIPQMIVESQYFSSPSYLQDTNATGIKYRPQSPSIDSTAGRKSTEGDFYARFKSKDAFAKDYKRILSLQRTGNNLGKPIDAKDLYDFNERLYANGYYGKSLNLKDNYIKGLLSANKYLLQTFPTYTEMLTKKKII